MHCKNCPTWLYKKCDDYYDCVYPIYAAGVREGKKPSPNNHSLKRVSKNGKRTASSVR